MVFLKNLMSEKAGNIVFGKNHNKFCRETLCDFLDNSPKISRLVRKLRYFYKSMKKYFSKNFCKHISDMFGKLSSQLVKAIINCLLTGLAFTVPGFTSLWSFSHSRCKLRLCE